MSSTLSWVIVLVLALYTLVLLGLSARARKKASHGEAFLHGGRTFGFRHVFVLVTVMWASSIFVVEFETGFLSGISALWFGVSVIIMSIVVARYMLKPFQRVQYLTNSRLIGNRFGVSAQRFSAMVIGLTFPIFAMSNVLAAAEFVHVLLGFPFAATLVVTTAIMVLYVAQSGMWSLAYTQAVNLVVLTIGIAAAVVAFWHMPSVAIHPVSTKGFHSLLGVGLGTIVVWVMMNLLNSVSAQAEMQAIASVQKPRRGQAAVYVSACVLIAFTIVPVWLGMKTREMFPNAAQALAAFPMALERTASPLELALVALGVWAAALSWCAPLLFSGASSLGADIFAKMQYKGKPLDIRTLTRYGLILQGILVVIVALVRPDELAWWRVFGQTIRSAAIFAPTVSYFLWPLATKKGVLWSMIGGVVTSILWNAATGFSATVFLFAINPMWVGLSVSMIVLLAVSLSEVGLSLVRQGFFGRLAGSAWVLTLLSIIAMSITWTSLPPLRGALFCTAIVFLFLGVLAATTKPKYTGRVMGVESSVNLA